MNEKEWLIQGIKQLQEFYAGFGICCQPIMEQEFDSYKLERLIHERIPIGTARAKSHWMTCLFDSSELHCRGYLDMSSTYRYLGTLEEQRAFIEVRRDCAGNLYVLICSDGRHLGAEVMSYYSHSGNCEVTEEFVDDLKVVQKYADLNRRIILREIVKGMNWTVMGLPFPMSDYMDGLHTVYSFNRHVQKTLECDDECRSGLQIQVRC